MSQAKSVASNIKQNYVVAIGASAGGLEAIHEFFDHMPANSSFAFIVIQHLSSDYKSLLVELVSKHTHMRVFEAGDNMLVQQDCVYIIPNNKLMTIRNGRLRLEDKIHDKTPNTAIDTFLYTLAQDKREKAIAIILSGTGTDGTKGIEAIKDCGGLVLVQEPNTAKFDGMPNSAITSGNADFILPTGKMHEELYNYIQQEPVQLLEGGKVNEQLLTELFNLVHQQSGHDFNFYKTPTIIRRIARRMNHVNVKKVEDYVNYLHGHPDEVTALGKEFLIGVTKFFRDKPAFDILADKVIPAIVDSKSDGDILKVWICACSTGEEAYSIAILINECLEKKGKTLEVKIFASDIDEASLEVASRNLYPASIEQDVDEHILDKYFIKEGRHYAVISTIRKQIVFARHNVIKAPPFIKNDLISCRNMLIYMNALLQQKVLSTLHFSLNQEGYLFLGSSESASVLKDGLIEVSSKWKLYQKSGSINYSPNHTHFNSPSVATAGTKNTPDFLKKSPTAAKTLEDEFREFVTEDIGLVGIFINNNYEVKETVGNFNRYLSLPEKKLDLNLLKMVPRELSFNLNNAIRKAWKEGKTVKINHMRLKTGASDDSNINISIKPPGAKSANGYTLITFRETVIEHAEGKESVTLPPVTDGQQNEYVLELENELNETRHNLQLAVEEMETTNEELQSSNEELLSANEELQSGNEELQSLNEELHTLNTEHQLKIKELIELNDDLNNYFKSTEIGQIFLDASLNIRKFNPAAIDMVNLIEADVGRPISHISHNIRHDSFIQDITAVLLNGNTVEKEVHLKNGNRSLMRIMPFVRKDKQNDGLVITFIDISAITELNNIVSGVFNASISAVLAFRSVRDQDNHIQDFKCIAVNNAALQFLNKKEGDLNEALLTKQLATLQRSNFFEKYVKVVEEGITVQEEIQFDDTGWYLVFAVKMADGFAVTYTNITERKNAEQKLRKNYNELISVRENLKKLNQELEDKVKERTLELSESEERFKLVSKATNDTIWDWNLVNNTMWRSENFTAMFGYHRTDDTENISYWFDKVHPDDRQRVEQSVYDAINQGKKQWTAEYRFLKADNRYAVILDRGSILQDEFGTPYRMVGSIIDITRLVEAEKRLSNSEIRFRKVFDSNMIGMLFSSFEGLVIDANDAFLSMLGYTREELHNGQINWKAVTPPEYMEITDWSVKQLREFGVCPPFEKEYIKKGGARVSVLMGAARLDDDSSADAVTYIIDITHQKETEHKEQQLQSLVNKQQEEFYSIFMNAPALITIYRGKNLQYEFVNKAFRSFYGDEDYVGKTAADVYPDFVGSKLHQIAHRVMKTGEPNVGKSVHVKRIDPVSRQTIDNWFDFIYTPVYAQNGEVDGIAFFGFDVTDLIKAQQATKQLMQRKDEFMSIASHELKTPITSLKGSLQIATRLVQKDGQMKSIYPFIEKAGKQTGRLTALVDDLLDVTKIHAGKMLFNYSWFNAGEVFRECIEDTQAHVTTHTITIQGDANVQIHADRHRLEQVISNLISNAIKYSPDATEIIFTNEVNDGMLKVSVQDFGIGIPPDKKDFVFDRFFRVQESSHKFSGLGLGLYITSEIIRRHEGVIGVESAENKGSTFWFYIPIHEKKDSTFISN